MYTSLRWLYKKMLLSCFLQSVDLKLRCSSHLIHPRLSVCGDFSKAKSSTVEISVSMKTQSHAKNLQVKWCFWLLFFCVTLWTVNTHLYLVLGICLCTPLSLSCFLPPGLGVTSVLAEALICCQRRHREETYCTCHIWVILFCNYSNHSSTHSSHV